MLTTFTKKHTYSRLDEKQKGIQHPINLAKKVEFCHTQKTG